MQWRIALSSLGGVLWTSIFTPVAFHFQGAEVAGQVGMTLALCFGLGSIMATWVQSRAPQMAELVARKDSQELHRLLYRLIILTAGTGLLGAVAIQAGVWVLEATSPQLSSRLLPPPLVLLFLVATVIPAATAPLAVYVRAHKTEPFLANSLVGAGLLAGSVYFMTSRYGAAGMALAYLGTVLLVAPWGVAVWLQCRLRWYPR